MNEMKDPVAENRADSLSTVYSKQLVQNVMMSQLHKDHASAKSALAGL